MIFWKMSSYATEKILSKFNRDKKLGIKVIPKKRKELLTT